MGNLALLLFVFVTCVALSTQLEGICTNSTCLPGDATMWCYTCTNAASNDQCNSHFESCGPGKQACKVLITTKGRNTRITKSCLKTSVCQNPDVMTCNHNKRKCTYCTLTPGCNDLGPEDD